MAQLNLTRGDKLVGMQNLIGKDETLAPYAIDTESQIAVLIQKLSAMETLVAGKVDKGQIKTEILYNNESVLIKAEEIALAGGVTFLDYHRDITGKATGVIDPSLTIIRGGVIQTEAIIGPTWGADSGMAIDLDDETITIGGSENPKLFASDAGIELEGTLKAGSIITGSVIIAGKSSTIGEIADDVDSLLGYALSEYDLDDILSAGVGNVVAGTGNDFVLDVNSSHIIARHKDANPDGLGAGYSGALRTGLLISSNGIAMGYNNKSTGAWVNTLAIDGTTGAGTYSGALSGATGSFAGSLSAATGTFSGSLITSGSVIATGSSSSGGYVAAVNSPATTPGSVRNFVGVKDATGTVPVAEFLHFDTGVGVQISHGGTGQKALRCWSTSATGVAISAYNSGGGAALALESPKISGDANFLDDVDIDGAVTVDGHAEHNSTANFDGNTTFNANVTLGNATSDVVTIGGHFIKAHVAGHYLTIYDTGGTVLGTYRYQFHL